MPQSRPRSRSEGEAPHMCRSQYNKGRFLPLLKLQYVIFFHHKRAQFPTITKAKLDDAMKEVTMGDVVFNAFSPSTWRYIYMELMNHDHGRGNLFVFVLPVCLIVLFYVIIINELQGT